MKQLRKISNYYYQIYNHCTGKEMILLSLSLIIGFLWPLAGAVIYLTGRFWQKELHNYGVMALTGAGMNIVFYFVQILVRAYEAGI